MYKDYLKQLPPSLARVVFRAKTRNLDIKTNYKNKYSENLECPFCCVLDESFDHIFTCRFGITVPKGIIHFRLQSFSSEVPLPVLERLGSFLQNTVHILSKWLVDYNGKWYVILLFILMLYYVLGFNQFH